MHFRRLGRTSGLLVLLLFSATSLLPSQSAKPDAPAKGKPPVNRYGLLLKYRKAGEDSFKATRSCALECFQQEDGSGIYLSQSGALAVIPASLFEAGEGKEKGPLAQHGLELAVRKADGKTVKFGLECYRDENNGHLLYITQTGSLAVVPARYARPTRGKPKGAPLTHHVRLKVRQGEERMTYGVAVFEDRNNDNLIYLSETGAIAVVPRALIGKETTSGKAPAWRYAFRLGARAGSDTKSGKATRKYAVEVYEDTNNGCLVFIGDTGNLAVVPSKRAHLAEGKARAAVSRGGLTLTLHKADSTRRFGVEVFDDKNSGQVLYLSDNGGLATTPGK